MISIKQRAACWYLRSVDCGSNLQHIRVRIFALLKPRCHYELIASGRLIHRGVAVATTFMILQHVIMLFLSSHLISSSLLAAHT